MMIRFAIVPLLLALNFSMCKKQETVSQNPQPSGTSSPTPATPVAAASPKITKPVVDQTAQTIIFCYHLLVDKVRYPGTEITPAAFEAQMKELKDRGITVISMQDLLAWKRGEKNIPPRCAVITFDDGYKAQYEVAWPILKKYGYPFTMFIYTEGVRGGSLGGGGAITWEQLADMRDNGVDIEAHSATHQDMREGHTITLVGPGGKKTRTKLTGPQYEEWVQKRSSRLQGTARATTRHQSELFCRAVRKLQRARERTCAKCRLRGDVYCLRSAHHLYLASWIRSVVTRLKRTNRRSSKML